MPITKTELFDINALDNLLRSNAVTDLDKLNLRKYRRRAKLSGNDKVIIQYDFSANWASMQKGRLMPQPFAFSQCSFPSQIGAALAQKFYWDLDFKNSQPTLALQIAKKHSLLTPGLEEYCERRDEILKEMVEATKMTRDEVKNEWIRILFGGTSFAHPLIPKVKQELTLLAAIIKEENPTLYAHVLTIKKEKNNPLYSCFSIYLQNEERLCLMALDSFLSTQNRSMDCFKYDGGHIRKLENETQISSEFLHLCEKAILDATGYELSLQVKPLQHTFEFGPRDTLYPSSITIDDIFACRKFVEINPDTFLRDGNDSFMRNPTTGLWGSVTFSDFKEVLSKCNSQMIFRQDNLAGIRIFNYGGNLRNVKAMYEFLDVCIPKGTVPIEFLGGVTEPNPNAEILELFQQLISLVSNHDEEKISYLTNYFSHTLQKPRDLPGVCIIATGEQGSGKDTPFDIFMKYVLGSFYTANFKNEDFFSQYDDLKARKVMVKLEEASPEQCAKNSDMLKNLITGRTVSFNPKHKSPYTIPNFTRYIFTTNSGNPITLEGSDRRYVFFNSSLEKVGDAPFWTRVNELLFTEEAGQIIYHWLVSRDISSFSPRVFPVSEYQEAVRTEYKTLERRFVEEWDGEEISVDDFYRLYVAFCRRMKLKEDMIPNKIAFGKKLLIFYRDKIIQKRRREDGVYYSKFMTENNPTAFL